MRETKAKDSSGGFLIGVALGAIVGVAIYYFLDETPQGKKTVKKIEGEIKDNVSSLGDIIKNIDDKKTEISQKVDKIERELESKIIQVKEEIIQDVESNLSQVEKLQTRGRKFAKFFTKAGRPVNKI